MFNLLLLLKNSKKILKTNKSVRIFVINLLILSVLNHILIFTDDVVGLEY